MSGFPPEVMRFGGLDFAAFYDRFKLYYDMMKNIFLSAAWMLLSISAFAQTTEENLFSGPEDFDTYPREVYCEIESYTKRILTNKVAVKVDFGQEADFRYKDSRLVDENGEDICYPGH